jgi:outer membrane protein OmpA-like peptidoglycan-associated protein
MKSSHFLVILFALSFSLPSHASNNYETHYGLGLLIGTTETKSQDSFELDRTGSTALVTLDYAWVSPLQRSWNFGLGYRLYDIEGEEDGRKQEIETKVLTITASHRWHFGAFEAGLGTSIESGKASTLKIQDLESNNKFGVNIGPELAYRWIREGFDHMAFLSASWDLNVQKQVNQSILIGYKIWCKEMPSPIASTSVTPEPQPVSPATITPEPLPTTEMPIQEKIVVVRFRTDVFQFEFNKDVLVESSRGNIRAIAAILVKNRQNWDSIEIGGHADGKASKRNTELSELRAKAVMQGFMESGIKQESLTAKGYGVSEPVPGLPAKSPEHRRVELKIRGNSNADALSQDLADYLIPNSP